MVVESQIALHLGVKTVLPVLHDPFENFETPLFLEGPNDRTVLPYSSRNGLTVRNAPHKISQSLTFKSLRGFVAIPAFGAHLVTSYLYRLMWPHQIELGLQIDGVKC